MEQKKFILSEKEIPTHWYDIVADLKNKQIGRAHV